MHKAREITGADAVVCIMSGNFVQRGENAIFDKFTRAKAVIEAGADAVVELPTIYSLQSAEYFSYGSVQIADNIGCTHLCFGSESGDLKDLISIEDTDSFKTSMSSGASYGNSLQRFNGEPNNLLGCEYLKALDLLNSEIIPSTVKRSDRFSSASKIRAEIKAGNAVKEMYPISLDPIFFDSFFEIIKYRILCSTPEELNTICGVNEGLEHKLKSEIYCSNSIGELIQNVKSKRYTYSRISRILCCVMLNITKRKLRLLLNDPPKVKMLAVNKDSVRLLSELNNYYISPIDASKYGESTEISSKTNILSTEIYSTFNSMLGNEDYTIGLMKI